MVMKPSFILLFNNGRSVSLATNTISNVGQTALTLLVILSFVAFAIVNLNDGKDIPIVNQPDIDEFIVTRIQAVISLLELTTDTIRKPFCKTCVLDMARDVAAEGFP